MATSETHRAYARGYYTGSRGGWPPHRPPLPPHELIRGLMEAVQELRDAADTICATISEDDEFAIELAPKIDAVDEVMMRVTDWLRDENTEVRGMV